MLQTIHGNQTAPATSHRLRKAGIEFDIDLIPRKPGENHGTQHGNRGQQDPWRQ
jgi:hypothetical protein